MATPRANPLRRAAAATVRFHSWKLFVHILLGWDAYDNPVYLREAEHRPVWRRPARWTALSAAARQAALISLALGWIVVVLYFNNLLLLLVPPLLYLAFATAFTLAPIVVQERLSHSWETLLSTPYSVDSILLSKVAGALTWMRPLRLIMGTALIVVTGGVALLSLVLIPASALRGGLELLVCGLLLLVPIGGGALFLADRIQQYMLMVAAALAAGAASRTLRNAFPAATGAVLLVWLGEALAGAAAVSVYAGRPVPLDPARLLALVTLGPSVLYIAELDLAGAALMGLGTLLLREALIAALWRWSVRLARPQAS